MVEGFHGSWEAGKRRLAGDTARAANTDEVKDLRREARDLKEVVAEQSHQQIHASVDYNPVKQLLKNINNWLILLGTRNNRRGSERIILTSRKLSCRL